MREGVSNIFAIRKSMCACYKSRLIPTFVVAILLFCNVGMVQPQSFTTAIPCRTDSDCKTEVGLYSSCRPGGICSTNPYEQGCLFRHGLVEKMRICNSEDDPNAAAQGLCRLADIKYPEVRLYSPNWESAIMETWILQIILSELLDVPTSTETGLYDAQVNFYNHWEALDLGAQMIATSLETAALLGGDCELANSGETNYQPCAHVVTEIWESRELWDVNFDPYELPPQTLGVLGQEGWFVPKFTGQRDPTLLSYFGLQGEENRQKLVDRFLRPTTWKEYCDEVSNSSCQEPDDVASRAPLDEIEYDQYFVQDVYTGHFRKTEENDCEMWPLNCTGHIADYPCGWGSFTEQQAYHLGIALQSSGQEPGARGYTYPQMIDIWLAANQTESDVMMVWWFPEQLHQRFLETPAEFQKVNLPPITQECLGAHVSAQDRCSSDFETRVGDAAGACDEQTKQIYVGVSKGLYNITFRDDVQPALHSPGYEAVKSFQISSEQLSEAFNHWLNAGDPREGVCNWMVDNIQWATELIPETYPRTLTTTEKWNPLRTAALALSVLTTTLTVFSLVAVYYRRDRRVMVFAQVEFLLLILSGLLCVSIGAVILAVPPTDGVCVASVWLVLIGYTLEIVPLCTKVSVINRLMHASASMKRFVVQRKSLFGVVTGISAFVLVFLLVWTIVDPPQRQVVYVLTDSSTPNNELVVEQQFFCASRYSSWTVINLIWMSFLLVCAAVLAFQTRGVRQEFNESQTMTLMIYSHAIFLVLRVVSVLASTLPEPALVIGKSIILSLDTLATLVIYFLPKFLITDDEHIRSARQLRDSSWMLSRSELDRVRDQTCHREDDNNLDDAIESGQAVEDEDDAERHRNGGPHRRNCARCGGAGLEPVVQNITDDVFLNGTIPPEPLEPTSGESSSRLERQQGEEDEKVD